MDAKLKEALLQNAELRTRIGEAETEAKTATTKAAVGSVCKLRTSSCPRQSPQVMLVEAFDEEIAAASKAKEEAQAAKANVDQLVEEASGTAKAELKRIQERYQKSTEERETAYDILATKEEEIKALRKNLKEAQDAGAALAKKVNNVQSEYEGRTKRDLQAMEMKAQQWETQYLAAAKRAEDLQAEVSAQEDKDAEYHKLAVELEDMKTELRDSRRACERALHFESLVRKAEGSKEKAEEELISTMSMLREIEARLRDAQEDADRVRLERDSHVAR
eukprot:scaffold6786_cov384-Prasinococcus_capsulatus_cf.AAC.14